MPVNPIERGTRVESPVTERNRQNTNRVNQDLARKNAEYVRNASNRKSNVVESDVKGSQSQADKRLQEVKEQNRNSVVRTETSRIERNQKPDGNPGGQINIVT